MIFKSNLSLLFHLFIYTLCCYRPRFSITNWTFLHGCQFIMDSTICVLLSKRNFNSWCFSKITFFCTSLPSLRWNCMSFCVSLVQFADKRTRMYGELDNIYQSSAFIPFFYLVVGEPKIFQQENSSGEQQRKIDRLHCRKMLVVTTFSYALVCLFDVRWRCVHESDKLTLSLSFRRLYSFWNPNWMRHHEKHKRNKRSRFFRLAVEIGDEEN